MTSEPNRPLAGVSLPQWMKSRITDRYDLEQSAFSPPSHDDGFFLIRYRSKSPEREQTPSDPPGYQPISQVLKNTTKTLNQEAFSKHTEECQQFIPLAKFTPREIGLRRVPEDADKLKSTGTDDGFKGDAAACGYSVLQVAQTMVSGESKTLCPPSHHRVRRNSKSLPASPLSSPKLLRKNPFFTDGVFGSTEGINVNGLASKLSGMVMISGDEKRLSTNSDTTDSKSTILKARPSELREMNFWSPTSM